MMQSVGLNYVRYFNHRYKRTGTLWEGRYRSTLIQSHSYFLTCSRYIELNPVRAQIAENPAAYQWSSFRHNAAGHADALVTPHPLYRTLGTGDRERQRAYLALLESHIDPGAYDAIRHATNAGIVLGNPAVRAQFETASQRRITRKSHGGDRRSALFHAAR